MTDLNEIPKAKKHYPHCLRFVLKGVWFDKIKSGEKRIEYREVKPYWDKRIRNLYHFNNTPDFNKCIFTRGYTSEMLIAEIERIEIIYGGNTDLHVNKNVYAIHIKNVKEYGDKMTKDEYQDFALRYKGCGACFPMYHTLSRPEKMWFTAIQKDVAELEKENAELKEKLKPENCLKLLAKGGYIKFTSEQLAKAKELLAKWVELFKPKGGNIPPTPIQVDTEQFLSEVEK